MSKYIDVTKRKLKKAGGKSTSQSQHHQPKIETIDPSIENQIRVVAPDSQKLEILNFPNLENWEKSVKDKKLGEE